MSWEERKDGSVTSFISECHERIEDGPAGCGRSLTEGTRLAREWTNLQVVTSKEVGNKSFPGALILCATLGHLVTWEGEHQVGSRAESCAGTWASKADGDDDTQEHTSTSSRVWRDSTIWNEWMMVIFENLKKGDVDEADGC